MKTAVQWLKEQYVDRGETIPSGVFQEALEKEKEQIIYTWEKGYSTGCVVGSNDYTNEDEEKDNGNYYYNQTYNTKQHIIDIMKEDENDGLYNQNK